MSQQLLNMVQDTGDASSSDEEMEVPFPHSHIHIKLAYKRAKSQLQSIRKKKHALLILEKRKQEESSLLKKLLQNIRPECTETPKQRTIFSTIISNTVPRSKQIPKCKKRFTRRDIINKCRINITIDLTRQNIFYITVKKLLSQLKLFTNQYKSVVALELLHYVIRLILEKRLNHMLVGIEDKLKSRALLQMYREIYPIVGDDEFVKTTLCDLWLGEYNDPVESDSDLNIATDKPQEEMYSRRQITVEEIFTGSGEWETILHRDKPECAIIEDSDDNKDMDQD